MQFASAPRFEPLTLGMLLDRAIRIYVDNFSLMMGISAIIHIPQVVLAVAYSIVAAPILRVSLAAGSDPTAFQRINPIQLIGALAGMAVVGVLMMLWYLVVRPFGIAATTKAVSERYLGNEITIGAAFRASWNVKWQLLAASLVVFVAVVGGLLLVIVPGIIFALSYALVAPVVMIEHLSASESRERSWALVSGSRGRILLVWLIVWIVGTVVASGFSVILGMFGEAVVLSPLVQVAGSAVRILLDPIGAIAMTLFYYDLRVRKEGFDLEILRQSLAQEV